MIRHEPPFDPKSLGFDAAHSTAVLIACESFPSYPELVDLPEARQSVVELGRWLGDPEFCGFGNVVPIVNHRHPDAVEILAELCKPLQERDGPGNDCLLIYFAGHGIKSIPDGQLHLSMRNTQASLIPETALAVASIKRLISTCKVAYSILILDCCYAGSAITEFTPQEMLKSLEDAARYVICSSAPREKSSTPTGSKMTGFCGELIETLRTGVPNGQTTLSLRILMKEVGDRCDARKLSSVWLNFTDKATKGTDELEFVRNTAFQPAEAIGKVEAFLPSLDLGARSRLQEAIDEDKRIDSMKTTAEQFNYELYQSIVSDQSYVNSAVAKWLAAQPFFREYFQTSKHPQTWKMLRDQVEMTIAENGDTSVRWIRRFRTTAALWYIWVYMGGDEPQPNSQSLQAKFILHSVTRNVSHAVVPFQLVDDANRKDFVLYLPVEVPPQDEIELELDYRWPKLFTPLMTNTADYWELRVDTVDGYVPAVDVSFSLCGVADFLNVSNSAQLEGMLRHEQVAGRSVTRYSLVDVANGTNLRFDLQKAPAVSEKT